MDLDFLNTSNLFICAKYNSQFKTDSYVDGYFDSISRSVDLPTGRRGRHRVRELKSRCGGAKGHNVKNIGIN